MSGGFRQIQEAYLLAQVHGLSNFKDLGPLNSKKLNSEGFRQKHIAYLRAWRGRVF
jgi:hypothetical protein